MSRGRSRGEERSLAEMIDGLETLECDLELIKRTRNLVPAGWDFAHAKTPCAPKKVKMTIRLDARVYDWYRGLGFGYQNRINEVLRCYMNARISKHIEQPGNRDWKGDPL